MIGCAACWSRRAFIAGVAASIVALLALVAPSTPRSAAAQSGDGGGSTDELGPIFTLSLGGKLYDDVWAILDLSPPTERNPAFPDLSASARDTWRCVSCHGWDYGGADGERARSTKGLTAPSLRPLRGVDPRTVIEKILKPSHPFPGDALADLSLVLLAHFISAGQYDREAILEKDGRAVGDAIAGRNIFEGACINCHELDGRAYLKGEAGDRSSLGWVARNRPEQALHKILNGVPMAAMLSLRFLPDGQIADLMAYIQTVDPSDQ